MSKPQKTQPKAGVSAYAGAARVLPFMTFAWIGLLLVTAILALCPRFTGYYAVYLLVTLALAGGALAFIKAIYREGKSRLHPAFKKFLGYGLVLHYAAAALPRVDWANEGLVGQGRVIFLFVLSMLCLVAGFALFIAMGRPAAYAALGLIEDEEVKDKALRKKRAAENRKKGFLHGTLEWIDALGFAAILVILINTFIFQLYEIPSESMVPAFLIKDRPFTSKLTAGPRIPLTDWRLPFIRLPKRGDIITLSNPRYPENQSVNPKKYLAQLVSMITFTAVNIDRYLPDGSQKNDPLVKRVVGVPGEKLMMVDDVLYAKRAGDSAFSPVEEDKTWARIDLWKESADLTSKIQTLPIDEKHRAVLDAWDRRKREADPAALVSSIAASARAIAATSSASQSAAFLAALAKSRPDAYQILAADISALVKPENPSMNPISALAPPLAAARDGAVDLALALSIASYPRLKVALSEYAACPSATVLPNGAYEKSGRILNLLIKDNYLKKVARETQLIASGMNLEALLKDSTFVALTKEGNELDYYMNGQYIGLYDERNFPEFPSGDAYLGREQYFAMGDNRYNSLDFRYKSGDFAPKSLDPADPASAQYLSNIDPFALDLRFIEGYAIFRIWPPTRVGAIR
jgi:signal peptidase I